jgi:hypothetical protein
MLKVCSTVLIIFYHIAIIDQTNRKKEFESLAPQGFQILSWFGFQRKAL